jgi:hypothetical protein
MTFDIFSQLMIFVTGVMAVFLAGSTSPQTRVYAGWFGMAGEPFWFATAYLNQQWGILLLVIVYAIGWGRMIINNRRELK